MNDTHFLLTFKPIIERAKKLGDSHAQDRSTPIPIIAIAGGSGSGKSYFADQLKKILDSLHCRAEVINQNGFSPYNKNAPDALINVDHEQTHQFLSTVVHENSKLDVPFRVRNHFPYSSANPLPHIIEHKTINFGTTDLIIFEGSFALSDKEPYNFFRYCNFGIFIEASLAHMQAWKIEREMSKPEQLQRPKEIFEKKLSKGLQVYQTYILPTKQNASFVVYKEDKDRYTLIEKK